MAKKRARHTGMTSARFCSQPEQRSCGGGSASTTPSTKRCSSYFAISHCLRTVSVASGAGRRMRVGRAASKMRFDLAFPIAAAQSSSESVNSSSSIERTFEM
eukprot:scaffold83613_cov34-Tisochrysis_lutea.AAC.4